MSRSTIRALVTPTFNQHPVPVGNVIRVVREAESRDASVS
jgi:hypothetical protein